jgi:DNA-binding XRE family transcriptional regulator
MTQAGFAELLQVSKPTIQKLEAGNYPPSEKMAARLAELFRSEKFRGDFMPRVETGDLGSVKEAFGSLLELADAEGAASSARAAPAPNLPNGLTNAYTKDHVEFLSMMRSQQDTIHTLSKSTENFSESSKSIAESNKNLSETSKNLSESGKGLVMSTQNLSESNKKLSESNNKLVEHLSKSAAHRNHR